MRWVFFLGGLALVTAVASDGGCGGGHGGMGDCGGGDGLPTVAELPKVEEPVVVAGLFFKVNRLDWGFDTVARGQRLGRFVGEELLVEILRTDQSPTVPPLYQRNLFTSGALRVVKTAYGTKGAWGTERLERVDYLVTNPAGEVIHFRVTPTKPFPKWSLANDLVLSARRPAGRF